MERPRLHRRYDYLSKRLLREIYDTVRAKEISARQLGKIQTKAGPVTVDADPVEPQPDNVYWLAEYAHDALEPIVGSLATAAVGGYLRAELPLTLAWLPVGGISDPVAWMYAKYDDEETGYTVVVLCGSIDNYRGFAPGSEKDTKYGGWYPSTAEGMRQIFQAMSQGNESEARINFIPEGYDVEGVANMANTLTELPRSQISGSGYYEVLAEVFLQMNGLRTTHDWRPIDTLILGAPLWVRSTAARPFRVTQSLPPEFAHAVEHYDRPSAARRGWKRLIGRFRELRRVATSMIKDIRS